MGRIMDVEEICSGWLTKSPSSKYVTLFSHGKLSIRVPLKSKWHRRYFVLHKPHGSLPHQYAFDYFKDEHDHRRRGTINLEECESILSELDSSHYPHLFSIKTKARNKDRVYYLAAETEDDMVRWVKCLCSLCDLKMGPTSPASPRPPALDVISTENHTVAPNPPIRHDSMQLTVDLPSHRASSNQNLADEELSNKILEEIEAIEQGRLDVDSRPMNDRVPVGYTELADCTTGDAAETEPNGGFIELYDVPKPQRLVTPSRLGQSQSVRRPNKPFTESIQSSRSANSSPRCARTLPNTRFGNALAPPRPPKTGQPVEDLYQNISNKSPLLLRNEQSSPLLRPNNNHLTVSLDSHSASSSLHNSPMPSRRTDLDDGKLSQGVENFYLNTANLSADGANDITSAHAQQNSGNTYDVPRNVDISATIPAPTQCSGATLQTAHRYVNAPSYIVTKGADGVVTNSREVNDTCDSPSADPIPLARQQVNDNQYNIGPDPASPGTPTRPPKPRNLSDTMTLDDDETFQGESRILKVSRSFRTREYTKDSVFSDSEEGPSVRAHEEIKLPSRINTNDSSSTSSSDRDDDDDVNSDDESKMSNEGLYATPPAPRPVQPQLPERLHHSRPFHSTVEGLSSIEESSLSNVKRSSSMSKVPAPYGSTNISKLSSNAGSPSPKLKNNNHNALRSERSSTFCATDWRNKPLNVNSMGIMQPLPRTSHRTPPESVGDIQYVELDQSNDRREPSPLTPRASFSNMIPVGGQRLASAPTDTLEYTDIDLLKTQALTVTRRERDLMKRGEDLD